MNLPEHFLPIQAPAEQGIIRRWLFLGVGALALAGVFAGMLANTKSAYFYMALVAHVDLSVLVWFLSFACLLMNLAMIGGGWARQTSSAGYCSAMLGTAAIAASAFTSGTPFQNNYIPVIYHPLFFLGISLLFCAVLCVVTPLLLGRVDTKNVAPVRVGIFSVAVLLLMAVFCFFWSFHTMPLDVRGQSYYDDLFWAGGHVLQIAYTQLMLVAWLWLSQVAGIKLRGGRKVVLACYALGVLAGAVGMMFSLVFPVGTTLHHDMFTQLMKHANGLPAMIMGAVVVVGLCAGGSANPLAKISLVMSLLLFAVGGGLGHLIAGSTVTTPAHYHGSIVGVTLALMGLAYVILPQIGLADVSGWRLAKLQPVLYGGGQLCWMMGMAIGGAHGVGRKIIGSADVIGGLGGMLKHSGDGLSLIGGLLFVFIVLKSARSVTLKDKK